MSGAYRGQKKASDPLEMELENYEQSCSCCKLNEGPVEEQLCSLRSGPSLQPLFTFSTGSEYKPGWFSSLFKYFPQN